MEFANDKYTTTRPHFSRRPPVWQQTTYSRLAKLLTRRAAPTAHITRTPEPLPAEIWTQIIQEHTNRKEWTALSRTCQCFHRIVQALLYENVDLQNYLPSYSTSNLDSLAQFARTVKKRPELGALVHNLSLDARGKVHFKSHPLLKKLNMFPNLHKLHVNGLHIEEKFCFAIHTHPHLKALKLNICSVDKSLINSRFNRGSITEVEIIRPFRRHHAPVPEDAWMAVIPVGLRSLTLDADSGDLLRISLCMMESGNNRALTTLHIDGFSIAIVLLLIDSPQIRFLHISTHEGGEPSDFDSFSTFPADSIPLLEEYIGPAAFCQSLVRGRPVRTVGLIFDYTMSRDFIAGSIISLRLSSVSVVNLELRLFKVAEADLQAGLWDAPTSVRRLRLHWTAAEADVAFPALPRLTELHTVCIVGGPERGLTQEDITQISDACPTIQEIYTQRRGWVMKKPHLWESFSLG